MHKSGQVVTVGGLMKMAASVCIRRGRRYSWLSLAHSETFH
jgi:hypothetical protein